MTTKHKITMFSTLCLAILSTVFLIDTTDKKASIPEKTEKKIIVEKKPTIKKVIPKQEEPKKTAPIAQRKETKKVSDNNKSTVTFEIIPKEKVTDEMISDLSEDIFSGGTSIQDYTEKYDDYKYFKADFMPIFKAKVGEIISINIAGKIYKGELTKSEIKIPTNEDLENDYEYTTFNYRIQLGKRYARITIHGRKNPDGNYYYEGDIVDVDNAGLDKQFFFNNGIGIIMSEGQYAGLYFDPNIQYEY